MASYKISIYSNVISFGQKEPSLVLKDIKDIDRSIAGGWLFTLSDKRSVSFPRDLIVELTVED